MAIKGPKELFLAMLTNLHHGAERSEKVYEELGKLAQDPEVKEILEVREQISRQIRNRLDQCFKILGEQPGKPGGRLHDAFIEEVRAEAGEIQGPVAKRLFVLAKALRLMHLRAGEYVALIAVADSVGHPAVGMLLESCLADKLAFAERTKRFIREQLHERMAAA
jgi:ferritin-like metal-binding protein YciE